jgi:hypothetical protein
MIMAQSHPPNGARAPSGALPSGFASSTTVSGDGTRAELVNDPLLRTSDDHAQRLPSTWKVVYAIVERGPRKHWLRIGMAFVNRDGSLNVRLDAVPLSGQLHIRDNPPRDPRDSLGDPLPPAPVVAYEREPSPLKSRGRASTTLSSDA